MIEHIFQVLGYYHLLDILSHYAVCPVGQTECLSLSSSNDLRYIDNQPSLVSEMRLLLKAKTFVSLLDLTDRVPILRRFNTKESRFETEEALGAPRGTESCRQWKELLKFQRSLWRRMYDQAMGIRDREALVKML